MELGTLPSFGDWGEDDDAYDDVDDDDDMDIGDIEDEENFSNLLQSQMNASWRSNLLPRSRFLELTVFKKMLAQGLHLTRHERSEDGSSGKAHPTTVFADQEFRHIWWYQPWGTGIETFAISSLLNVGTATDPKSGSTRQDVIDIPTLDDQDHAVTFSLQFSAHDTKSRRAAVTTPSAKTATELESHRDQEVAPSKRSVFFSCPSVELYHVVLDGFGMVLEHAEAAVREPNDDSEVHHLTIPHAPLTRLQRVLLTFHHLYKPEHHPNHPRHTLKLGQEVEVLYSSEYVIEFNGQLMRLPNPFFGPGMNCRGKVASYDSETENYTVAYLDGPFEHDEPLPASASIMNRGSLMGGGGGGSLNAHMPLDGNDNSASAAPNGGLQRALQSTLPAQAATKKNFPKGTLFEYVKRANLIADLSADLAPASTSPGQASYARQMGNALCGLLGGGGGGGRGGRGGGGGGGGSFFTPHWPVAVVLVTLLQLVGSLYAMWDHSGEVGGLVEARAGEEEAGFSGRHQRPVWMFAMQIGFFGDWCPDNRSQAWRLWTYQFLPSSWPHLVYSLLVQLLLGIPVNMVHGDLTFLVLTQGFGIPMAALAVGYSDSYKVIQNTIVSGTGGVFALVGVHLATLLLNFPHATHGLLTRTARLAILCALCGGEALLRSVLPDQETSTAQHWAGTSVGFLFAVCCLRNLQMTHFERTYVIPAATWVASAFVLFSVGWCAATNPPAPLFLFPTSAQPPCCARAYDCDLVLEDLKYFVCHNKLLEANHSATAVVKDQTCAAYAQYAGLQIAEANRTHSDRGFFGY